VPALADVVMPIRHSRARRLKPQVRAGTKSTKDEQHRTNQAVITNRPNNG